MPRRSLLAFLAALALLSRAGAAPAPPPKKDKPKAVTTPSGLRYEELEVGAGAAAGQGNTLRVHYTGWLPATQKPFDSSRGQGRQPFEFRLGAGLVIKGWDEGVAGMKVGGKRRLTIPPALGYGARGAGTVVPPNAVMIFEVELLRIEK